jgi:hypothetical protein
LNIFSEGGVFVESEQKSIDEYAFIVQASSENSSRTYPKRFNPLLTIERWITNETTICKRVLRLRSCLYLKIPWNETSILWDYLLRSRREYCLVPNNCQWITLKKHVDPNGNLLDERQEIFEEKKRIYDQWVSASLPLGYYAEKIYLDAFNEAKYTAKKVKLLLSPGNKEEIEIDIYGAKDGLQIGAQVKNVTSEVFTDPKMIHNPSSVYWQLTKQFEYCSQNGVVPILIAPFVNKRFYNFTRRYSGLHCQTYLELFSPKYAELCYCVRKILKFGNVAVATEAPQHVKDWIDKIPQRWHKRYAK